MKVKIPNIKITFRVIYWFPFSPVKATFQTLRREVIKRKLKRHFQKLQWKQEDVWNRTRFCGSLDEAVVRLRYELLESFGLDKYWLHHTAEKMILDGFENRW